MTPEPERPSFSLYGRGTPPPEIHSLEDWERFGKPAKGEHWKRGRSAYEMACSWLGSQGPDALRTLFARVDALAGFEIECGIVEAHTQFDAYRGPRNHDLLLVGRASGRPTVVSVEGKADEPFGQTIEEYRDAARAKRESGESTNAPERLNGLLASIAGWGPDRVDANPTLRYQLFSGVAGALAAAADESADQAVFCVHELGGDVEKAKLDANAADLQNLVDKVFPDAEPLPSDGGQVWGPARARAGSDRIPATIPLYIAKMRTDAPPEA